MKKKNSYFKIKVTLSNFIIYSLAIKTLFKKFLKNFTKTINNQWLLWAENLKKLLYLTKNRLKLRIN